MPRCLLVFEPPDGGVAEHVRQLATALPQKGWDVEVAGPREAVIYEDLDRRGTPVVRLPIGRELRPGGYALAMAQLARLLRGGRYDLVHVHSSKAGAIARPAARAGGVPVVYTPHCFAFIGPHGAARKAATAAAERALARITAAIVCVAESERREAREHRVGREDQLHVVHNGCPACDSGLAPDPELDAFASGRPLAGCISVLRPQKSVETFIHAAPPILARVPDARLAVIGEGEMREELERLARTLDLGDALRFFAFTPPSSRQLSQLDLFVLPSAWEAFPISVLEALACGVPQVATDVGGTAEAIAEGATGLLCPPSNPDALAARVAELLLDSERRERMASASVGRHRSEFEIEPMVEGLLSVYDRVLAAEPAPTLPA